MTPLINQALSLVYTQLSYFSESSNYYQVLSTAFGNNYDRDIAEKLKLHWQQVNFTQIPQIEILDGGILGSAYGAYARETNKIYLSRNFVTNNTAEVIGRVILEELGHFVDGQLNVEDSEGDEGAIFAELVVGNSLDDQALRKLRTESDFGIITLNGQQVHVELFNNLPGVSDSSVAWADYDGDGRQDFLLTGFDGSNPIAKLYKNTGNGFKEDTTVFLPGVGFSSVAWADYDGDGKQDFLLTGFSSDFTPIAKLYKNTGNGFKEDTTVFLPGVDYSSVAWVDYDGDGKQDFLLTGYSSDFTPIAKLYRNTGNGFEEKTPEGLPGVRFSSVAWVDYDGDGKQDFLLTGYSSDFTPIAKLYRNTGNGFEEKTPKDLPGVGGGSVAWVDYDGDGKQDFLLTGYSSDFTPIAKLYRNTGNGFEENTNVSLPGVGNSSVAWADYDGDKKQDFLLTGWDGSKPITLLVVSKEIFSDVTLAVSPTTVTEDGTSNLVYTFTRTGVISNVLTVNYTIGGTATNSGDYGSIGTSVTFAAGSSTATVTVDPTADTTVESDETVILTLASGTGYTIGTTSGVTGTITNDDTQVTLAVSPTTVTEDGTSNLVYTFTRTGVISNALTVNYTIGGTATNSGDYGSIDTSVTFAAGSSTATVTVNVDPTVDTTVESDETVILTLASGTGYTIGTTSGVTGTIVDDDTAGTYYSSVLWFDYDNDFSKEEFLLTGYTLNIGSISQVHKYNNQQSYKAEPFGEKGLFAGSVALSSDRNYLLLTGATKFDIDKGSASEPTSKLYKNTGSVFKEDTTVSLPGVYYSSVAWADYDQDGDQDFLLTGLSSSDIPTANLYKNTGSGFEEDKNISLPGVYYSSVAWSNDGKYLLLTGESVSGPISKVYENQLVGNNRRLVAVGNFPNVKNGSVAWADYDKDGDQDFLLTGLSSSNVPIAKLYKNTGSGFEEDTKVSLPGVYYSSVAWADYDKDGDQDFVLTGFGEQGPVAKLYKKTNSGFEDDAILSIPGVYYSSVNWNKNGDLVLTGLSSLGPITKVYKNIYDSNTKGFTETIAESNSRPDSRPDVTLSLSQRNVKEGESLTFTFTRRGDTTTDLKVTYRIGGTAGKDDYTRKDDYTNNSNSNSNSITIPAGQQKKTIEIKAVSDVLVEGLETLELSLETSDDYTVGTTNPVQGFIQDTNVSNNPPTLDPKAITGKKLKTYPEQLTQGADLSKLSYQFLEYNSPTVRAKLDSALNLTNSVFTNFLGLYEVDDPETGAVNGFFPGDSGYAKAALSRRVTNFSIKAGGSATNITTNGVFAQNQTPEGNPSTINDVNDVRYLAPFLIANIGSRDVTDEIEKIIGRNNSSAEYQDKSVAYFSFGAANPDGMSQIKHFGNGIFGFEDLPLNVSDRDFNDTVFSFGQVNIT